MQVLGLGQSPDNVTINGALQCYSLGGDSTQNFWLSAENLAVVPTNGSTMTWSVSQGTSLRRVHVNGSLNLSDGQYSSGGFLADSKVNSTVSSGTQQQWLSRNDIWGNWSGASLEHGVCWRFKSAFRNLAQSPIYGHHQYTVGPGKALFVRR